MDNPGKNKKTKILRIIARLNIGGPAIHTILLTRYLDNQFETKLVAGNVSEGEKSMDYLADELEVKPIYIEKMKRKISLLNDMSALFSIYTIVGKYKPDIVHTHTAKAGAIGRTAVILYNLTHLRFGEERIRLVHTFHGHVFDKYFGTFKTSVFIRIERILAVFTDNIIAVSDRLKHELVNKYKIASDLKIKVIYNGYNLEPFLSIEKKSVALREQISANSDELIISTVGRLVPVKGHEYLIKALSKIDIPSRLVIVGDGILRDKLEALVNKYGLNTRVHFLGYQKDLQNIYSGTDIFVLSSLNEGTPVAIIEALASARPVIATDVGGVRDIIGNIKQSISPDTHVCERGMLITPSDTGSIIKAIKYLVNNTGTGYIMGLNGRRFVENNFNIKRLLHNMTLLYRGVLK